MDKHKHTHGLFVMLEVIDIAIAAVVRNSNPTLFDEKNDPALELTPN